MSRSERYLPRHARGQHPARRPPGPPRHASPLTTFRRWRNRHERAGAWTGRLHRRATAGSGPARRLGSAAGWALLLAGSLLVFVLAWQLIGERVSADSAPAHAPVHQAGTRRP